MTVLIVALVLLAAAALAARYPRSTSHAGRDLDNQLADLDAMRSYRQYP